MRLDIYQIDVTLVDIELKNWRIGDPRLLQQGFSRQIMNHLVLGIWMGIGHMA